MGKCYCQEVKLHSGESARCEWCAVREERRRCVKLVRAARPDKQPCPSWLIDLELAIERGELPVRG